MFCIQPFSGTHTVAHPSRNGKLAVTVYGRSESDISGYGYEAGSSVQVLSRQTDGE